VAVLGKKGPSAIRKPIAAGEETREGMKSVHWEGLGVTTCLSKVKRKTTKLGELLKSVEWAKHRNNQEKTWR